MDRCTVFTYIDVDALENRLKRSVGGTGSP